MNMQQRNWVFAALVGMILHMAPGQPVLGDYHRCSTAPDDEPVVAQTIRSQEKSSSYRAEILSDPAIRLVSHDPVAALSDDLKNYRIRQADGPWMAVREVEVITPRELRLYPAPAMILDPRRVYYLHLEQEDVTLLCSFDGWMRELYSDKELGARFDAAADATIVRVFAPRATRVRLYLYREREGAHPEDLVLDMQRDAKGVWELDVPGNFEGWWYDFTVHGFPDPGNEFHEQVPVHVTDPYARVSDDSFGRARIWPRMQPPPPVRGGRPAMEDVIAYEVHVEDFTLALPGLDSSRRGSFAGFAATGLRNAQGEPVGFDHLVDLGINVVHLMPVQEFLHIPDDEWREAFADDPYMRDQMIAESNYQWGYRTTHAFAIESRYRTRGSEPGAQNREFRDLIAAFHEKGIAVIVDLVFNHTAERMDRRDLYFNFRVFDRHMYYRTNDELDFIGEYGTETKSEDRPMTARWIYDQCLMLMNEYGVDGFRIDLAGLTDEQTLRELRRRLPDDAIIYGEPWIGSADPDYESNPEWDWYKEDAPITFFQDECRNALCGSFTNPENKRTDRGYPGGSGDREAAKRAIANTFEHEDNPNEGINYLDIHDNWTLADRFAREDWNGLLGVHEDRLRIAAAMLMTSLGPVVMHGGTEFLRSKASAPLVELVKHTSSGPIYIHGKRDSYNLRRANLFLWDNLGRNLEDGARCDFQNMKEYWKGLIALRRSDYGKVFRLADVPQEGYITWVTPANPMQLGYIVGGRVAVLVNTDDEGCTFHDVPFPDGDWELVAAGDRAGLALLEDHPQARLRGGRHTISMKERDIIIWLRR